METLFTSPDAPTRVVHFTKRVMVIYVYGFVEASSAGFGSSFELSDGSIYFRHGVWGAGGGYFSYLGLQISLRKLHPPNQHPGPWAGTIVSSCPDGIDVTCPAEKWNKAKKLITELCLELDCKVALQCKPPGEFRPSYANISCYKL